ncbi:MAG: hypothetical protein ACTHMQ_09045 [Protaetiibacter sp.]
MAVVTRPLAILGALVLVALAFVVSRTEPEEDVGFAPFAVRVAMGQVGEGRGLQGAIDDAVLADTVRLDDWTGRTTGTWLVVRARMATTENPSLGYATLHVGDRIWVASNRAGSDAMHAALLDPGLPVEGSFVFEIPADLVADPAARSAIVRLADDGDTRLITVIETELDLTALEYEPEFEIAPRERTWW